MNYLKLNPAAINKTLYALTLTRKIQVSAVLCEKSLYEILRVPENATQSEIKQAYYKLSKVYHPDIKQDENSLKMFRNITEAYDILGNIHHRKQYDKGILGKNEPYESNKMEFYGSLYRNSTIHGVADYFKIKEQLNTLPKMDKYLNNEYNDRLAELRMVKNDYYDSKELRMHGEYGVQRTLILLGLAFIPWSFYYLEYRMEW